MISNGGDPSRSPATAEFDLEAEAYARAFESAPTGVVIFDLAGLVRHVNPALCRMLGQEERVFLGRQVLDFVQPKARGRVEQWFAAAVRGEVRSPVRGADWYVRADGTRVYGMVEATFVAGEDGAPRYGMVMVHDQTETRMMEEALVASNRELDRIIAGMPVAIYKLDGTGLVQTWNPAAEAMFGWTEEEVVGRPVVYLAGTDPANARRDSDAILSATPLEGVEVSRVRSDGTPIDLAVWTTPVTDDQGTVTAVVCAAVDITERKRAAGALEASAHRFQSLVKNISDTVTVLAADGTIEFSTAQDQPVLGYPTDWWPGRSVLDLAHPDDVRRGTEILEQLRSQPGRELTAEFRARHSDGGWEYIHVTGRNLLHDPDVAGIVLTSRNVTEQRHSDMLLAAQAEILELIATSSVLDETLGAVIDMVMANAEGTRASVLLLDRDRLIPRGTRHLPHDLLSQISNRVDDDGVESGAIFRSALDVTEEVVVVDVATDERAAWLRPQLEAAGIRSCWSLPVVGRAEDRPLGSIAIFHDEAGEPSPRERRAAALAAQLTAIAVERQEAESQLAHRAMHDDLTGLPNRTLLLDRLTHALVRARHLDEEMAVLFLDLDRFKVVNDSLGHRAGDELLVLFTQRLLSIVRPEDTVARFGGDEFVVLCEQAHGATVTVAIAERLEQAMRQPFLLQDGAEVFLTVSLGLATGEAPDAEVLLRNADAAMYRAKELGRNRLEVFDDAMQAAAIARLTIGNDLRRAVERNEFVVLHQPLIDIATRRIIGAEALVRWNHPTRGLLPPASFISVTEESGLVVPIGEWVLDTALGHAASWATELDGQPFMQSVNLSARQLSTVDLTDTVAAALERHGWPAEQLCLELTESVLLDDLDVTLAALHQLKALGVCLAIDDFGTGYSSLTYLQRFPVDSVKIDQSFVTGLTTAPAPEARSEATIPRAVVVMAHALGLVALAEGVETEDQLTVLRELGCDQAQGFLFSSPVSHEELAGLLARQREADRAASDQAG